MKKLFINIVRWIWYSLLIVSSFGLISAIIGLILKNDSIYYWGVLFSLPFYLIVLPCCLLLVVGFLCGSFYVTFRETRSLLRKKHSNSKDEEEEEMDQNSISTEH